MVLRFHNLMLGLFVLVSAGYGQPFRNSLPGTSVGTQYAGSVGLLSVNAMRHARNERLGFGIGIGHVPHGHGGPLTTYTVRAMYTPWQLKTDGRWQLEPLQAGLFVTYTSGLDLTAAWPSYLEKGYYWWTPNFRQHVFLRTQLSYRLRDRKVQRIAAYLEANTNDLYVYSWWPNRGFISVYDIVFFGAGVQVYFQPYTPRPKK